MLRLGQEVGDDREHLAGLALIVGVAGDAARLAKFLPARPAVQKQAPIRSGADEIGESQRLDLRWRGDVDFRNLLSILWLSS